jgi:peptidoglycan/xylan/chitin deacetylase (PgdA/CDA1 family)
MKKRNTLILFIVFLLVTSCEGVNPLNSEVDSSQKTSASALEQTTTYEPTQTPTVVPTETHTPTTTLTPIPHTITPTPWALSSFDSSLLYPDVSPISYIENTCTYLDYRWGEGRSEPGTIVVPIMFHSILEPGRKITDPSQITREGFEFFMDKAEEMGFETVTMKELLGFLKENQAIPERSMLLILDDRRPDTPLLFMPYLEENDWTLTLAWPTTDKTSESLWEKIEGYVETGYIEVQPHGHNHASGTYFQEYTPLEVIEEELYRPIEVIQEHFGTDSFAYIWPGGNFTALSVEIAREAGYELGFTAYQRGPLMFNWIPLGEPEQSVNDPLMVLPRYWSINASQVLDKAVEIGEEARAAAEEVREEELLYYSLFCQSSEGE